MKADLLLAAMRPTILATYAESLRIYRRQARQLLIPAFLVFVVVGLPTQLLNDAEGARWEEVLLTLAASLLSTATVILFTGYVDEVAKIDRAGRHTRVLPTARSMLPIVVPLGIVGVLYGLAVLIGLVLLIVPGIFLAVRLALASPIVSLRREHPLRALRESWNLTRGSFWLVLGAVVVPLFAEGLLSHAVAEWISHALHDVYIVRELADAVVTSLIAPLVGLQMAFVYLALSDGSRSAD